MSTSDDDSRPSYCLSTTASLLTSVPLASVRMLNNKDGLLAGGQCEGAQDQLTKLQILLLLILYIHFLCFETSYTSQY